MGQKIKVNNYFNLSVDDIKLAASKTSKHKLSTAYIYYIKLQKGDQCVYKLGYTTNLANRLRDLAQINNSYELTLVHKFEFRSKVTAMAIEQKLHNLFWPLSTNIYEYYLVDVLSLHNTHICKLLDLALLHKKDTQGKHNG